MNSGTKLKSFLLKVTEYILSEGWMYLLLMAGLYFIYKMLFKVPPPMLIALGILPIFICLLILLITHTTKGFYALYSIQFLLVMGGMIMEIKMGVTTLILTLFIFTLVIIRNIYEHVSWQKSCNGMLILYAIWGVFCIIQIVNPNNVQEAWNIAITHYLVYPMICAILVPLAIKDIKGIEWLLIIWSIFIIIASGKGYWQKTYGFNEKELYFLYVLGQAKTHIIWSGIRYFSCFSDAANFGVHMAMAIPVFGISLFYVKSYWMKIYFFMIVLIALYGMGISGTRAAVAVPIGAIGFYILLSRNAKVTVIGVVVLLATFSFFQFTDIGNGNQYIRKMRSAFNPTEDASYQLRVHNRARMKELMKYKPIGYGQGLAKADRFHPKERMPYPPDSWLVAVWVENGIIGATLYILVHAVLFAWCSWILIFKIMNKRLRGLLAAWLCMAAGFFVAAYANDVMQYPNSIIIYTAFALCFAGIYIDKQIRKGTE